MMKLKVCAEMPGANTSVHYRAILENPNHVAGMLFSGYSELIAFIVEMPIDYVVVLIHNQGNIPYGYRLDSEAIKDSISFYQSGKRGRKRVIEVGNE